MEYMKHALIILALITFYINSACSAPKLIIYHTDGKASEYDITKIDSLNFEGQSGLYSLSFHLKDGNVKEYISKYIRNISFEGLNSEDPALDLNFRDGTRAVYAFSAIDSIATKTNNTLSGVTYDSAEITIMGITWEKRTIRKQYWFHEPHESKDTSFKADTLKSVLLKNDYFTGKEPYLPFICKTCNEVLPDNYLNFCNDYRYYIEDQMTFRRGCNKDNIRIYLDTTKRMIDSACFISQSYSESVTKVGPDVTSSDDDDYLTIYSIPYTLDKDKNIVADITIYNIEKYIDYSYTSNYSVNVSADYHSSSLTSVVNTGFTNGKSGRIRIKVFKE